MPRCYLSAMVWREARAARRTRRRKVLRPAAHRLRGRIPAAQNLIFGHCPSNFSLADAMGAAAYSFNDERDVHAFYNPRRTPHERLDGVPTVVPPGARLHGLVDHLHARLPEERFLRSADEGHRNGQRRAGKAAGRLRPDGHDLLPSIGDRGRQDQGAHPFVGRLRTDRRPHLRLRAAAVLQHPHVRLRRDGDNHHPHMVGHPLQAGQTRLR